MKMEVVTYSFFFEGNFFELIQKHGLPPLPPYIRKKRPKNFTGLDDKTSYQTVFAKNYGSIAAPTAGLHFSDKLLKKISTHPFSSPNICSSFPNLLEYKDTKNLTHSEKYSSHLIFFSNFLNDRYNTANIHHIQRSIYFV